MITKYYTETNEFIILNTIQSILNKIKILMIIIMSIYIIYLYYRLKYYYNTIISYF